MKLIRLSDNQATTLRRFLFEISAIIVGVLIALSFDGIADWRRHRQLVREAKANLRTELRDNREEVAGFLKGVEPKRKIVLQHLHIAEQVGQQLVKTYDRLD